MRSIQLLFCLSLLLVTVGVYDTHAQETPPPADDKTEKKIATVLVAGKPEVNYLEGRQMTVASVLVYLVGEWEGIRDSKDVLQLNVRFRSQGKKVTQPAEVEFGLTSYAKDKKYTVEHKLTLIADGQTVVSKDGVPAPTNSSVESEYFRLSIGYAEWAKFANAKRAVIKFGGTTVELTDEMSKSLRDLDAKIQR